MIEELTKLCKRIEPVGSRVTCNPAPTDTDEDFLCLFDSYEDFSTADMLLYQNGYEIGGSQPEPVEDTMRQHLGFYSYKKGSINYIFTCDNVFFSLFMAATKIAKERNLLDKQDRIDLFQHMLYGNY